MRRYVQPQPVRTLRFATLCFVSLVLSSVALAAESQPKKSDKSPPARQQAASPAAKGPAAADSASPKNVDDLKSLQARVQQVAAKVLPAVVAIRVGGSQGSGVVVTRDGFVITAGHVVTKPGDEAQFTFADGKTHKGICLGADRTLDSGLMKISDSGPWPAVEMGHCTGLKPGAWCIAVGHPLGYQEGRPPVVRIGRIRTVQESVLSSDCSIVAGDSGGPLFDIEGKVIGINSRIGNLITMNYHVPVDVYRRQWDRLAAREMLGVDLPSRDGPDVKTSFRAIVAEAGRCTARVKANQRDVALGTIVGPDGWILTKASELKGPVTCQLADGRVLDARIVGTSPQFDLAMLKIDVRGLPAIQFSGIKLAVGQWVAAPGVKDEPLAVGVIGVPERKIPPPHGAMGVVLSDGEGGPKLSQVLPHTPAETAGLRIGDVITHVNDVATPQRADLLGTVKTFRPGETITLTVKRGNDTMKLPVRLARLETPSTKRRDLMNLSGGGVSNRRDDFPNVLQHDGVIAPSDCGGPLVDLSGKVIGVNIARGGRTETYAIPTATLLGLMYDLMSGRLAPPEAPKPPPAKSSPGSSPQPALQ